MNGFTEPLPGLLDDPQFQISNLPTLPDVHIAPLRNPAPSKRGKAPLPLEPFTKSSEDRRHGGWTANQLEEELEMTSPLRLKPSDVLSAREAKKPHLAISELVEASNDVDDNQTLQLPSFVSLAVVEKSPVPAPSHLSPHKRLRLDLDTDVPSRDVGRRLPRPAQKDEKQSRPVPLIPAMVTGLHEPPPSAGILPSMDLDARPNLTRASKTSKMQVKNILAESKRTHNHVPPEAMLNTPDLPHAELPKSTTDDPRSGDPVDTTRSRQADIEAPKKDMKHRRARRKWSEEETADLLAGVKKYGFGKWKQILVDSAYTFNDRTSIDLKDRYRVYVKDDPEGDVSVGSKQTSGYIDTLPHRGTTVDPIASNDQTKVTTEGTEPPKGKRKRRPWTPGEDAALMRGLAKHGFQWTAIHDDSELNLSNRRATDLRDRIRNLYPEGYKQAEARPLRSEARKGDRTTQESYSHPLESQTTTAKHENQAATSARNDIVVEGSTSSQEKRRTVRGKASKSGAESHQAAEQAGVTLPSLALDHDNELDWGNNTLPPLLEWEDMGI